MTDGNGRCRGSAGKIVRDIRKATGRSPRPPSKQFMVRLPKEVGNLHDKQVNKGSSLLIIIESRTSISSKRGVS